MKQIEIKPCSRLSVKRYLLRRSWICEIECEKDSMFVPKEGDGLINLSSESIVIDTWHFHLTRKFEYRECFFVLKMGRQKFLSLLMEKYYD